MKADLIPCPECGAEGELKQAFYFGDEQSFSYVHCTNPACDLFCHNPHFAGHSPAENDEHAAASWNDRFAETQPLAKDEFVQLHRNDVHDSFLECLLKSFSWDRVVPFHDPDTHRRA